jgi:hypothetical protein
MHDPLQRLYRTKLALLATLLTVGGLALLIFAHWITTQPALHWLTNWPLLDIGSGLFTTGLLGVALQYFDGQDSEERATQRLERVINGATPAMRDAVISGFAFQPEDLARVATSETLDQIASNALAIRLGDATFAEEIYADLREQAIGIPERLHDVRISIGLSMDRSTSRGRAPMFVTSVRWEYRLIPKYQTRRFVCLSDPQEFRELAADNVATSAWFVKPQRGLDAGDQEAFELLEFAVDGEPRPIRRTAKDSSQTYSVNISKEAVDAAQPVSVSYTYRTLTPIHGHLLQLRVDQPTKGLTVELDYSDCDLAYVNVLDFITGSRTATVTHSPKSLPNKMVAVDYVGWVFPRSGVAFVWVKQSEAPKQKQLPATPAARASRSS